MTSAGICKICSKQTGRYVSATREWICVEHTANAGPSERPVVLTNSKVVPGYRMKIELDGVVEYNEIVPFTLNRIAKNLEASGQVPPGLGFRLRRFNEVTVEYPSGQKRRFSVEPVEKV